MKSALSENLLFLIPFLLICSISFGLAEAPLATATLQLDDPIITKANWESALLRTGDLNGDGLMDFLTVNNAKSAVQVFYQQKGQPIKFQRKDIVVDDPTASVALGDLNGDRRTDLVLAPQEKNLQIRFQQPDGTLGLPVLLEAQVAAVDVADLDGDGKDDVVGLSKEKTAILYGTSENTAQAAQPTLVFNGASPISYPLVGDMDGNGLSDIAYMDSARRNRLLVRFQVAPRVWELETAFEISEAGDATILRPNAAHTPACLVIIHPATKEIRLYRMDKQAQTVEQFPMQPPRFLALDRSIQADRVSLITTDLNGDTRQDLVIASSDGAEAMIYLQNNQGKLTPRSAPSLAGITSLASVPRKNGSILFALSSEREETIGASAWEPNRGLTVPAFLKVTQKPLAMAEGDLNAPGIPDLAYLYKNEKKGYSLGYYPDPKGGELLQQRPVTLSLPLDASDEIAALKVADLNGDKRGDLLVFGKYSPLRILLQQGSGTFSPLSSEQTVAKGALNKVGPNQVCIADLDGNKVSELLIASETFARAYAMDRSGNLSPMEQFNGRNATARIDAVCAADLNRDGKPEVILLDSGNKCLTLYGRNAAGAYTLVRNQEIQGSNITRLLSADANGDGQYDLLLLGDAMQLLISGTSSGKMKMIWSREPEDQEERYVRVSDAQLLSGQSGFRDQLVALEGTQHVLEFFSLNAAAPDSTSQFFHFKVFDDEGSMGRGMDPSGNPEPRSLATADMDGNGKNDLLALIHDNVLLYLRK